MSTCHYITQVLFVLYNVVTMDWLKPKHVARLMKENVSCVSNDGLSFYRLLNVTLFLNLIKQHSMKAYGVEVQHHSF